MTDFVQDFAPRMPMVDVAGALSPFLNRIPGGGGVANALGFVSFAMSVVAAWFYLRQGMREGGKPK